MQAPELKKDVELFSAPFCIVFEEAFCAILCLLKIVVELCIALYFVAVLQIAVCSSGQVTSDKTSIWQGGCPMASMPVPRFPLGLDWQAHGVLA